MTRAARGQDRNLDVLRAIAVLLVLFVHVAIYSGAPESAKGALYVLGHAGVIIFFVHTSLVLMRSLERSEARGLRGWVRARDFYTRRAFRIYPLAIATVVAAIVFHLPSGPSNPMLSAPTPGEIVANLLLVQNLVQTRLIMGQLWSLPPEIEMYVVLPILFVLVRRAGWRQLVVFTVTAIAVAGVYLIVGDLFRGLWRLSVFHYVPCFVAGVVAFRACQLLRPRLPAWVWPGFVLTIVTANALIPRYGGAVGHLRDWLIALTVASFIPLVAELGPSLFTRTAHQVAKYSYGIYLTHIPVLDVAGILMRNDPLWLRIVTGALGVVVLPFVLYHVIEEPMIELGTRAAARLLHSQVSTETLASTAPAP
jgi:peptidoglycan/LPS O-acetylase OafA/YrhL